MGKATWHCARYSRSILCYTERSGYCDSLRLSLIRLLVSPYTCNAASNLMGGDEVAYVLRITVQIIFVGSPAFRMFETSRCEIFSCHFNKSLPPFRFEHALQSLRGSDGPSRTLSADAPNPPNFQLALLGLALAKLTVFLPRWKTLNHFLRNTVPRIAKGPPGGGKSLPKNTLMH